MTFSETASAISTHGAGDALDRIEESLLVLRARTGDPESFERLMGRYERQILYYLARFVPSHATLWDLHQDVWFAVFRGLPGLNSVEAFRPWLYRIAHDKAAKFVQREARTQAIVEPIASSSQEFPAEELSTHDAEAVHYGLSLLSAELREVLTLHYLRDLRIAEIALVLNCPVGTVKSRLHHARAALKQILESQGYEKRPNV